MIKHRIVTGSSGDSGGDTHDPVEAENNLQANTRANIVDVLCEGLIEGPANGEALDDIGLKWKKSVYFNETPLVSSNDTPNFSGVTIDGRCGYNDTEVPLKDFDSIDNITVLQTEITNAGGPQIFTITDLEVDSAYVTIEIPNLLQQEDNGDINPTKVKVYIEVRGDNGAGAVGTPVTADGLGEIYGKTVSTFRKQFYIQNLYTNYGVGPWQFKVYRQTADSGSVKVQNKTYLYSYTESKEVKMLYPDTAVIGVSLDSSKFKGRVPSRAYKLRGLKINYPNNYTPDKENGGGSYAGEPWNGNFTYGYCSNPAWVLYDILTNNRYGLGEHIDKDLIDKWSLYTIGKYCDENVSVITRQRLPGGGYTDSTANEPRFTFNGQITSRQQALAVVNHIASVFRGYPIWGSGYVSFVQDSPKDIVRIANQANVKDGFFEYYDTESQNRTTAAKVSYSNMEMFGRPDIVLVEDETSIQTYGYNPVDIFCFGCTSRSEAVRRAKYILNTDLNQTEFVKFVGGLEWADSIPGEVIGVQDKDYVSASLSGRVVSATSTSITIDRSITIEGGETYTLYCADNTSVSVFEKTLTNGTGATTTLTWSGDVIPTPTVGQIWAVTKSSVQDIRQFQITNIKELEAGFEYEIEAVYYNENKYAEVETGFTVEVPPSTNLPVGKLEPPTDVQIQDYTYTDGDSQNRKYGITISWTASPDSRTQDYEIQVAPTGQKTINLGTTTESMYDWKDVASGVYTFRVRARGATGSSAWAVYAGFTLNSAVEGILPPTNVKTVDDPNNDQWEGPDCEIEWDASAGAYYDSSAVVWVNDGTDVVQMTLDTTSTVGYDTVAGYKIEVYTVADSLLRTYNTADGKELTYNYTYNMNRDDNSGSPIRQIKFKLYTIDRYGDLSDSVTYVASNPAPDMSSTTPTVTAKPSYLKIEWTPNSDNDMSHYIVYSDTSNPPTTEVGRVVHPGNEFEVHGLTYGTTYYVQIEPYDGFGVGIKSVIPSGESPLIIPAVNVDVELSSSITMTTDISYSGTLTDLYDGDFASGGVTMADPSGGYIQYVYEIENYYDRVAVWSANANPSVYFGLSDDGGSTWEWFAGFSVDTLTSYGSSQANAQSNAWSLSAGFNTALLPENVTADTVRIYFTNANSTTIYEFVPSRIIISELAAIEALSAISADIGSITAGSLQSSDYSGSEGMIIDLDDKDIEIRKSGSDKFIYDGATGNLSVNGTVTITGGSGISNLTDAGGLATEDDVDFATQVSGAQKPENNATLGATFGSNIAGGSSTGGYVNNDGSFNLSTDGKTVINGSTIEVYDGLSVLRVKIGAL